MSIEMVQFEIDRIKLKYIVLKSAINIKFKQHEVEEILVTFKTYLLTF